jgi:1,4-dihydroxy-2-naphthoate octaprenyltransferase
MLGDDGTRQLYGSLMSIALLALVGVGWSTHWAALVGLVAYVPLLRAMHTVTRGARGRDLIPVLQLTGLGELLYAAGLFAGLLIAR